MIIYKISDYGYLLSKELQSYNDVVLFANFNLKFLTKVLRGNGVLIFQYIWGRILFKRIQWDDATKARVDKNYPERFHFGVKSWFVIKKCENNAKIRSLLILFYRKCLTL